MNFTNYFNDGVNRTSKLLFSKDPPPDAPWGWPGCSYPLPLPESGPYAQATEWIWKTVPLCVILLGTVGNILTALVIFRNFRKLPSTAVYLLSLAFTDTLFLFNAPLKRFIFHVFDLDIRGISNIGCKLSMFLSHTSFHISAWILVAVTIERVVSVVWPYKVKHHCTQRNAVVATVVIVTLISTVDSHIIYGFGISSLDIHKEFNKCMPISDDYSKFYSYQWFWIHLIFGFATPFIFIGIGNILVIRGLQKMRMRQNWIHRSTGDGKASPGSRRYGYQSRTLMVVLILLNTIFFVSQTPVAIYLVYTPYVVDDLNKIACSDFNSYLLGVEKLRFWEALISTFGYLNASLNFVLYVVSGSRLRKEFVSLFMCKGDGLNMQCASSVSQSSAGQLQTTPTTINEQK